MELNHIPNKNTVGALGEICVVTTTKNKYKCVCIYEIKKEDDVYKEYEWVLVSEESEAPEEPVIQESSYQPQEDFVNSLTNYMGINKKSLQCVNIANKNFKILYELNGSNNAIQYETKVQPNDAYSLLQACNKGVISKVLTRYGSLKHDRKEGSTNESYPPNGFISAVGGKLYWDEITNVTQLNYYSYRDNRGGLMKFTLTDTDSGETQETQLSLYISGSGHSNQELFKDLDIAKTYSLVAEFMGDDPDHVPSTGAGKSRGWYLCNPDANLGYYSLILHRIDNTFVIPENVLKSGSNKDFAFLIRKKGSNVDHQFFPWHNNTPTAFDESPTIVFVDGSNVTSSMNNGDVFEFNNNVIISQTVKCILPNDDTVLGIMNSKMIFKSDGVVELLNNFKVLEDLEVKNGYVTMLPFDNTFCPVLKTSLGNKYDATRSAGYTNLKKDDEKATSFIAGGSSDDVCVAMTLIDPASTWRIGANDRRDPMLWLEHRDAVFQKLYPQVFQNGELQKGTNYYFGCKFIVCIGYKIDEIYFDI